MNQTTSDLREKTKAMESIMQRQYSDFSQRQSQLEKDFTANFIQIKEIVLHADKQTLAKVRESEKKFAES